MGGATYLNLGTSRRGYRAFTALAGKANGLVVDPVDDVVLVKDAVTPANNFCGSMAQALAAGILVYSSPPTKWLLNSSGILTSGSNLRCQYSAAGVPLGFLPEPQRVNLSPNGTAWVVVGTPTVTTGQADPTGGTGAILVNDTDVASAQGRKKTFTIANDSSQYWFSAPVKAGTSDYCTIRPALTGGTAAFTTGQFQFSTKTFTSGAGYYEELGNGWFWVSFSVTNNSTGNTTADLRVYPGRNTVVGDTGTIYVYEPAAQLEIGAYPTSPIINNTTSSLTRAADDLYVDLTKVPALGSEFTVLGEAEPCPDVQTNAFVLYDLYKDANDRAYLRNATAGNLALQLINRAGGFDTDAIVGANNSATPRFKFAAAHKLDDFELVTKGVSRGTDTSGALASGMTHFYIGRGQAGGQWAAPIGFLAFIPERLSQADMIARTS